MPARGEEGAGLGLLVMAAIELAPLPDQVPRPVPSTAVVLTTFGVLVATGLAAGVVPARIAARVDPAAALRVT